MSSDPRFARLQTDPRFRRPKQKTLKVEIDDRFRDVLESEEFGGGKGKGKGKAGARVDKRGRPLTGNHHQEQLKRFYRLRSPSPVGETDFVDYARGEGQLSSSGSEAEDSDAESEIEEEELEIGGKPRKQRYGLGLDAPSEDDEEDSDDESHLDVDLSENESEGGEVDDDTDEEGESEEEAPTTDPTTRIAAVNLDWDNLRATDLFAVFNSFLKSEQGGSARFGRLENVKIYPSEFGKERMAKEDAEGPAGGVFVTRPGQKKKPQRGLLVENGNAAEDEDEEEEESDEDEASDEEEEGEQTESEASDEDEEASRGDRHSKEIDGLEIVSDVSSQAGEEDIDMDQLRQYQLERLRYYYAVATFSSVDAAKHVMDECNGTEFERTANVMDLSYVPDGMDFSDDEIKDQATKEAKGYKGNDFVTDALRHSKVKLTWDQDDPNRNKLTRRTLTREEIEEQDFKDYVASSGSASEGEEEGSAPTISRPFAAATSSSTSKGASFKAEADGKQSKKQDTKKRTAALRALLLSAPEGEEEQGDIWGKAGSSSRDLLSSSSGPKAKAGKSGDMEITFRAALSDKTGAGAKDEEELTTLEKYQLRIKEKKARKKEKVELKRAAKAASDEEGRDAADDDFFGEDESEEEPAPGRPAKSIKPVPVGDDAPKLDLPEDLRGDSHFSMRDILKAEKSEGKKRKRVEKKRTDAEREVELGVEGWKMDVKDERFKALHEEPEFAIDPSNPHFTKTKAMQDMLAERQRVRAKSSQNGNREPARAISAQHDGQPKEKNLDALVQSVKRRMGQQQGSEVHSKHGKRRRR